MTQIKEDLIYFLKHGKLENISFDLSHKQIVKILGEPNYRLPEESECPSLLEYHGYEFWFEHDKENAKLEAFKIRYSDTDAPSGSLIFENYNWKVFETTIEKVVDFLNTNQIPFAEVPDLKNIDIWRRLITEGEVQLYFTNQSEPDSWGLYSCEKVLI